jgi:hypothetical protein
MAIRPTSDLGIPPWWRQSPRVPSDRNRPFAAHGLVGLRDIAAQRTFLSRSKFQVYGEGIRDFRREHVARVIAIVSPMWPPMSLVDIMIDQMGTARRTLEDGKPLVPTWQIATPEGSYHLVTEFDAKMPEQRERVMLLVSRFMTWKLCHRS